MRTLLLTLLLCCVTTLTRAETITVAADISMKEAMVDMGAAFNEETGHEVIFAFGSSGQLLMQLRNGAAFDVLVSAWPKQVDALVKDLKALEATRRIVAGNKLVLVVPAASKLELKSMSDLTRPGVKTIAVGDPNLEPAAAYLAQSLDALKIVGALTEKLGYRASVRQVLEQVERGEVDAGFVYATDAQQAGLRVKVIADVPADSHDPILYSGVVLSASKKQDVATKFLDFTRSRRGRWILEKRRGFVVDPPTTRPATTQAVSPRADD